MPDLGGILGDVEIPEITAGSLNTFIEGSSVIISWLGNESARIFDYSLIYEDAPDGFVDPHEWASDSASTQGSSLTLYDLDEGNYTFYITGRYDADNIGSELFLPFEIDAIQGPALRMYPLNQTANTGDEIDLYLYFEDVPDNKSARYVHVDIEINLNEFSFIPESVEKGDLLTQFEGNGAEIVWLKQYNSDNSVLSIDFSAVIVGSGVWGTGPIAKFSLKVNAINISNEDKHCQIYMQSENVLVYDHQEPPEQIHFPVNMNASVFVKKTVVQ